MSKIQIYKPTIIVVNMKIIFIIVMVNLLVIIIIFIIVMVNHQNGDQPEHEERVSNETEGRPHPDSVEVNQDWNQKKPEVRSSEEFIQFNSIWFYSVFIQMILFVFIF